MKTIVKKFLYVVYGILPFFAALLVQAFVFSSISLVIKFTTGIKELSPEIQYDISAITIVVCAVVFFFWYQYMQGYKLNIRRAEISQSDRMIHIIFLGIGCQLFTSGTMSLVKPLFTKVFEDYGKTVDTIFSGNLSIVIIYVILLAPITEELIFRGVLLKSINRALPFVGANLLQAVIFGIYHWDIVQGIYAFCIGLLLGFVYHKFNSLLASMFLHMVINASSFLLMFLPDKFFVYIIAAVSGGILIALGLFNIIKKEPA